MVWPSKDYLKTRQLENRTKVDYSITGHVRFSDPHCILLKFLKQLPEQNKLFEVREC